VTVSKCKVNSFITTGRLSDYCSHSEISHSLLSTLLSFAQIVGIKKLTEVPGLSCGVVGA